jgi:hypothetical protein
MPFTRVPDVKVDLVTVDWQLVAERIVDDLISQDAFQLPGPTYFDAEAKTARLPERFRAEYLMGLLKEVNLDDADTG